MTPTELREEALSRVVLAGIELTSQQQKYYLESEDDLGEMAKGAEIPYPFGYKRCGRCGHVKKFYLFNKNNGSKTNTSGNCKECQKSSAANSYASTKSRRNYKQYYRANREMKQKHARAYYENNKEALKEKHKEYLQTRGGKKVMRKAHAKRRKALAERKGIPYTREMVIERDSKFLGFGAPICYLCNGSIEDTSGAGLHLDHVIPIAVGGLDCFTNVAVSHSACNLKREKDARELHTDQIEGIILRAEAYIDAYPDKFPE